jgi:hypothetical protein
VESSSTYRQRSYSKWARYNYLKKREREREKTCTLIDVAIPADRNIVQKEAEKKLKYKSLGI